MSTLPITDTFNVIIGFLRAIFDDIYVKKQWKMLCGNANNAISFLFYICHSRWKLKKIFSGTSCLSLSSEDKDVSRLTTDIVLGFLLKERRSWLNCLQSLVPLSWQGSSNVHFSFSKKVLMALGTNMSTKVQTLNYRRYSA